MNKRFKEVMRQARVMDVIETERGWFSILEASSVIDGNVADVYGETQEDAKELGELIALAMRRFYQRDRLPTELTLDEELGIAPD
jgi:hypothetical protein